MSSSVPSSLPLSEETKTILLVEQQQILQPAKQTQLSRCSGGGRIATGVHIFILTSQCVFHPPKVRGKHKHRKRKGSLKFIAASKPQQIGVIVRAYGQAACAIAHCSFLFPLHHPSISSASLFELHFDKTRCRHVSYKIWRRSDVLALNEVCGLAPANS